MNVKVHSIARRALFLLVVFLSSPSHSVRGQSVAVKTNMIPDAVLSPNLGVEMGLSPRWTVEVIGELNGWTMSHGRRWKHWSVQPGARYWLCDRFLGHFIGVHAHGGQYNMGGFDGRIHLLGTDARKLKDSRYQGWFAGAGFSYGYAWAVGARWNLEAEIGVGYSYTQYDRFPCADCGTKLASGKSHHYVGPTKAAINIVYLF